MNKLNAMNYITKRTNEILDSKTIRKTFLEFDDIYKLGQASIVGFFLGLVQVNENFTVEDFEVIMEQFMKSDARLRCGVYNAMAEYMASEGLK